MNEKMKREVEKAILNKDWGEYLRQNIWKDHNNVKKYIPAMDENYIKNCIKWLDESLCGKYIPDKDLRAQFKSLFQNELSHRDTTNRLEQKSINVDNLPSLLDVQIEEFLDTLKVENLNLDISSRKYCKLNKEDVLKYLSKKGYSKYDLDKYGRNIYSTLNIVDAYSNDVICPDQNSFKKAMNIKEDSVNHPSHYNNSSMEAIDAIEAMIEPYGKGAVEGFLAGQVLKYIWRFPFKENPKRDLEKAKWYLDRLIKKY